MERDKIDPDFIDMLLHDLKEKLWEKIQKHGSGAFSGPHEAFGVITEEYYELLEEVRKNDRQGFRREAYDLIIAAAWGILSNERLRQESTRQSSPEDDEMANKAASQAAIRASFGERD